MIRLAPKLKFPAGANKNGFENKHIGGGAGPEGGSARAHGWRGLRARVVMGRGGLDAHLS